MAVSQCVLVIVLVMVLMPIGLAALDVVVVVDCCC